MIPSVRASSATMVAPISAGLRATRTPAASKAGDLVRGRAAAAGDDGAGVAHAAARRRRLAGDEGDDRLVHVVADELRRLLLGRAADLADDDDGVGVGVVLEEAQGVDEVGAVDRIAADADAGRLAVAELGQLMHRFVGQRAAARHHADAARLVDVARHDADLALARGDDAGAVGADQPRRAALEEALHPHHVEHRNALGDADDRAARRRRPPP